MRGGGGAILMAERLNASRGGGVQPARENAGDYPNLTLRLEAAASPPATRVVAAAAA